MLADNRGQDGLFETNGHFISKTPQDTVPKRNQNTRRAMRDSRTSEKAPLETKPDHDRHEDDSLETLKHRNTSRQVENQIRLGDYCLPPDRKEETLGGIASSKSTEYADPYETRQLMEAIRARGPARGPRFSAPCEAVDPFTYDLAKPLDDKDPLSKSHKDSFRHTYCEGNTQVCTSVSGTSVDSGVEDPDDYDHTITWETNNKKRMAQVMPNTTPLKTDTCAALDSGLTADTERHAKETVYAGPYEDPWDSGENKQKFDNIVSKAKFEYRKKSQSDDYEEPVSKNTGSYEEAWDLKARERKLESTVQEAHRRMSEGQKNLKKPHREAYEYFEPWKTPKSPEHSGKPIKDDTEKLVYSQAYEDPWDIKQREREQALEKQFSDALHSPKSVNKDDVPNFPAPPPPKSQPYEEAWNRNQISSRSPHNSGHSPNQRRRQSESLRSSRTEVAERIDPDKPLDIQKFYHGKIGRKYAEELLLIHKEGSYLVRRSETQDNVFSLSLKGVGGMPMHLRISWENGMYILGENSKPFPTVPEMIDHYTRAELPVLKADRIKLLHPIPRHS